jgi:hypothetical protein
VEVASGGMWPPAGEKLSWTAEDEELSSPSVGEEPLRRCPMRICGGARKRKYNNKL